MTPRLDRIVEPPRGGNECRIRCAAARQLTPHPLRVEVPAGDLKSTSDIVECVGNGVEVAISAPIVVLAQRRRILAFDGFELSR